MAHVSNISVVLIAVPLSFLGVMNPPVREIASGMIHLTLLRLRVMVVLERIANCLWTTIAWGKLAKQGIG